MILFSDFAPFVLVSPNLRFEALEQYIISTKMIDFRNLLGEKRYNDFLSLYDIELKILNITKGITTIVEVDSTALVESVDYCYINAKWHKGRVKMNVISINEIELFLDTSNIDEQIKNDSAKILGVTLK